MKDVNINLLQTSSNKIHVLKKIARNLLQHNLSCCVHISSSVSSYYMWNESLQEDREHILQAKIKPEAFETCSHLIKTHHNYDLPEIILLPIDKIDSDYLAWATSELT